MSLWTLRMHFDNPAENFLRKVLKSFAQKSGKIYIYIFSIFSLKCSSRNVECKFDNPAENFSLIVKQN